MNSSSEQPSYYSLTLDLLSDHRAMMHKSHEAFLAYGHQTMKTEREALLLKLALCKGGASGSSFKVEGESKWDQPVPGPSVPTAPKPAQFGPDKISEFATGSLTKCFGEHYAMYENRKAPRTPNGDLLLMSRILEVKGTRGEFNTKASLVAEYDVSEDAWFYQKNAAPEIPYSIIMEIALQPCGFLATFMGCTLIYPNLELCFRNLDSDAELLREVDLRGKTITASSVLTSVASSAETVIVQFDYELSVDQKPFYRGDTTFGYFTPKALANQIGLDRGAKTDPWYCKSSDQVEKRQWIDLRSAAEASDIFQPVSNKPFFYQPPGQLNFLDRLLVVSKGGNYSQGYVYGDKTVDPEDWFFPCHFYQDPVMPGSLGVESILETIRIFAILNRFGDRFKSPCFSNVVGKTVWKYRGQIIKSDRRMSVEAHIKSIEFLYGRIIIKADANLWKDGLRIYELTDAAVAIVESAV